MNVRDVIPPDDFASAATWANAYRAIGLAVIPALIDKRPDGEWTELQKGIPDFTHERWYGENGTHKTNYRMGFLTGKLVNDDDWKILTIDLDKKDDVSGLESWDRWIGEHELGCDPETWHTITGGGGRHIYFKYPAHLYVKTKKYPQLGLDVRADGGFIVAPPTTHQSGKPYKWEFSPFETELAEAPQWLLDKIGAAESAQAYTPPTESRQHSYDTDAWGRISDGREERMHTLVFAVIVDMYRESPIPPSEGENERRLLEAYASYERRVKPKRPGATLEDEKRGITEFRAKWFYLLKQWDTKIATAAADPNFSSEVGQEPEHVDDPVDLWAVFDAPALPRGLLPTVIENFAFTQGEMTGADPAGFAVACLAVCASAIPDRIRVKVKRHEDWYECARIWVALVGEPSTKKSPIMRLASSPLTKLDAEAVKKYLAEKARYDSLPKEDRAQEQAPKQVRVRLEDTTIEATQEILKDSPDGVLLYQDELSGWFGAMDKYSGHTGGAKDRGFWLQSFNGGPYSVNRIGRGSTYIENLSVSLLGGIQPDPVRRTASGTVDDGLLQRLFPIILKPASIGLDEERPRVADQYKVLIERLRKFNPLGTAAFGQAGAYPTFTLILDDDAQKIRRELEQKNLDLMTVEGVNRKLAAHIGKYDGLFARLCIVWHCIEHASYGVLPETINGNTAQRVADFLHRFLLRHAYAFYQNVLGVEYGDDTDALIDTAGYILTHKLDKITRRDVQRGSRKMRLLDATQTNTIMERLEYLGWLVRVPGPRPSSPTQWEVNPSVHVLFATRAAREAERRSKAMKAIKEITGDEK